METNVAVTSWNSQQLLHLSTHAHRGPSRLAELEAPASRREGRRGLQGARADGSTRDAFGTAPHPGPPRLSAAPVPGTAPEGLTRVSMLPPELADYRSFAGFAQEQRETPHFRVLLGGHGCLTVPVSVLATLYFQCPNPAGGKGPARPAPSVCLICAGLSREPGCSFPVSPFAYGLGIDKRSLSLLGCQSFIARGMAIYKSELHVEGSAKRVKWCFSLGSPEIRQP